MATTRTYLLLLLALTCIATDCEANGLGAKFPQMQRQSVRGAKLDWLQEASKHWTGTLDL